MNDTADTVAERKLEIAKRLDGAHQLGEAISVLESALEIIPELTIARYRLVRLLLEDGRADSAQSYAFQNHSGQDDSLVWAARTHVHLHRFDVKQALDCATKGWSSTSECWQAGYALHGAYTLAAQELNARALLDILITRFQHEPEIAVEWATRAELSPQEQHEEIRRLLNRYPECRTVHFVAITIESMCHRMVAAEERFQWLVQKCPRHVDLLGLGALLSLQRGDKVQTRQRAEAAIILSNRAFLAEFTLFQLDVSSGRIQQGEERLNRIRHWLVDTINEVSFVPQMLIDMGAEQQAELLLLKKSASALDTLDVPLTLGHLYQQRGDLTAAHKWVQIARDMWSEHFDGAIQWARLQLELGNTQTVEAIIAQLGTCEAVDELRLQTQAMDGRPFTELLSDYETHLRKYPSFDYVWGVLLRYYLEARLPAKVSWLLSFPRPVPDYVQSAVEAYQAALQGDEVVADGALERFLRTRKRDPHWRWCWELLLELLELPGFVRWLPRLSKAAEDDDL